MWQTALHYLGSYYLFKMLIVIFYIFSWFVLGTVATIESIAHRCSMIIQPPGENDSFDMLLNELRQNCFQYYNVRVGNTTMSTIKRDYNDVIRASREYSEAYIANERVLYRIQSWMNLVVDDPLTPPQRQLKECNAQLLVNTFNLDDMQNTMPIFIKGQEFMDSCFSDALDQIQEMKIDIERDCTEQIAEAANVAQHMRDQYDVLVTAQHQLTLDKTIFRQNVIDIYNIDIGK